MNPPPPGNDATATPDETVPRGLYAWTATWLVRFRDVYLVPWNIGTDA